ncbi:hypothetical protein TI05_06995 [Achromatium sp. WMS3]|nr:hypothetical protein TI05_06995 [Achromatium sp. WMS3]
MSNPQTTPYGTVANLSELLALRNKAKQLRLGSKGKVFATRSGNHLSRFRGRGMEFYESRPYQAGDEVRNMDWRVTARAGKPHVKMFREERERPVWLLVDLGLSMRFGTKVAFKSVIAAQAAALLAWAAYDQGDRVGGIIFDETQHFESRPAARTRSLLPLLQALTQLPLATEKNNGTNINTNSNNTNKINGNLTNINLNNINKGYNSLSEAALHLQKLVLPGSILFILSDFYELQQNYISWLASLTIKCEIVLIHIYDPLEQLAPAPGYYPVTNGFNKGVLDMTRPKQLQHWQQRFGNHIKLLKSIAYQNQALMLSLATNVAVEDALLHGLYPQSSKKTTQKY